MNRAAPRRMGAKRVQDLHVWQHSREFVDEISALLDTTSLKRDRVLSNQMNASSVSVLSNIAEGFGQQSDRAFARHLYISRGSAAEIQTQLTIALGRHHITETRFLKLNGQVDQIGKMLTTLIRHLIREDRARRP